MANVLRHFVCVLLLQMCPASLWAQGIVNVSCLERETVVYDEVFLNGVTGDFPAGWHTVVCMNNAYVKHEGRDRWLVTETDSGKVLRKSASYVHVSPDMVLPSDSFTVAVLFRFPEGNGEVSLTLGEGVHKTGCGAEACCRKYSIYIGQDGAVNTPLHGESACEVRNSSSYLKDNHSYSFPGKFDLLAWHNVQLSYAMGKLSVLVDSRMIFEKASFPYKPDALLLGGVGICDIREVAVSTGPRVQPFSDLGEGRSVTTHAILFESSSSNILPASEVFLQQLVEYLKEHPAIRLRIVGHTDNSGSVAGNRELSKRRADEVRKWLVGHGIAKSRLSVSGVGATIPIAEGNTAEAMAKNRRVEFQPQ